MRYLAICFLAVLALAFMRLSEATFEIKEPNDLSYWNATAGAKNTLFSMALTATTDSVFATGDVITFTIPSQYFTANVDQPRACNASTGVDPTTATLIGDTTRADGASDRTVTFTLTSTGAAISTNSVLTLFCEMSMPDTPISDFVSTVSVVYDSTDNLTPTLPAVMDTLKPVVIAMHTATYSQVAPLSLAAISLISHAYRRYTAAGTVFLHHQVLNPVDMPPAVSVSFTMALVPPPYVPTETVVASVNNIASQPIKNNMDALKGFLQSVIFTNSTLVEWGTATESFTPGTCFDKLTNGAETDLNCGGSECRACSSTGDTCIQNSDCASYMCSTEFPSTCTVPNAAASLSAAAAIAAAAAAAIAVFAF